MSNAVEQAVKILREGGLVAIPTETVYGLAADAHNEEAIKKVFSVKGRPQNHPLILHLAEAAWLERYAESINPIVWQLADAFWPGPLTLLLNKSAEVSPLITGGQSTVCLRMPAHPLTLEVIHELGRGIVAPSANLFGKISPTTSEHVSEDLAGRVNYILEGGRCVLGIESTILDVRDPHSLRILRQGCVTQAEIVSVVGEPRIQGLPAKNIPRISGQLPSHYAPTKPLFLFSTDEDLMQLKKKYSSLYCLSHDICKTDTHHISMPSDPLEYAYELYYQLRIADHAPVEAIAVQQVPSTPQWLAVADRLQRAAT